MSIMLIIMVLTIIMLTINNKTSAMMRDVL